MKKRIHVIRNEEQMRRLTRHLDELSMDKPKQVTVEDFRRRRSTNQNSLMWMWLHEIANDTGHTAKECHEIFKRMFLAPQTKEMGGTVVDIPPSTTKLTTTEFADYLIRIQAFAGADLGLMLTAPEGQWVA